MCLQCARNANEMSQLLGETGETRMGATVIQLAHLHEVEGEPGKPALVLHINNLISTYTITMSVSPKKKFTVFENSSKSTILQHWKRSE